MKNMHHHHKPARWNENKYFKSTKSIVHNAYNPTLNLNMPIMNATMASIHIQIVKEIEIDRHIRDSCIWMVDHHLQEA